MLGERNVLKEEMGKVDGGGIELFGALRRHGGSWGAILGTTFGETVHRHLFTEKMEPDEHLRTKLQIQASLVNDDQAYTDSTIGSE